MQPLERIIVALDVSSVDKALVLAQTLRPYVGGFKVGLEIITSSYVDLVTAKSEQDALHRLRKLHALYKTIAGLTFWDGKFADIPNTVAGAVTGLTGLGVKMFDVHASAGLEAIKAAVANKGSSLVLGVTVLTSLSEECQAIFGAPVPMRVREFAEKVWDAGGDGVVCAPQELDVLARSNELSRLLRVTPGIRSKNSPPDDQKRTMPAGEAIRRGASFAVIGRPILNAANPIEAAQEFGHEIAEAL